MPDLSRALGEGFAVQVAACGSQIGSGALPVESLPSAALRIAPTGPRRGAGGRLQRLAATLRALRVPVIGRLHDGALWLDLRCLDDESGFVEQLSTLAPS